MPLELEDFSASESDDEEPKAEEEQSLRSEDEGSEGLDEDDQANNMGDSYMSRDSDDETEALIDSILESIDGVDMANDTTAESGIAEATNLDSPESAAAELTRVGVVTGGGPEGGEKGQIIV